MMMTWSTVWATSARTWLETSTERPLAEKPRRKSRSQRTPSGSSPFAGSSSTKQFGVAEQRRRESEALAHPERVALDAPVRGVGQLDQCEDLIDARVRERDGAAERTQMVATGATRMEVGRLEHRADATCRFVELVVRPTEDQCLPRVGAAKPSKTRSVVVLPAPLGPRNPVIVPGSRANDKSSTAVTVPKRFVNDSHTTTGATVISVRS